MATREKVKIIRQTRIVYDPPKELGLYNYSPKFRVVVTSEEEEPGHGCVFCGTCVRECTHNLRHPELPGGVFWMEEIPVDEKGNRIEEPDSGVVLVDKILHIVEEECCNCKRCVKYCPQRSIKVFKNPDHFDIGNEVTNSEVIDLNLARSRGERLIGSAHRGTVRTGMRDYWMIDAAEILSPQRDHRFEFAGRLRTATLGKRVARYPVKIPIFDCNMSYGSNAHETVLARLIASIELGRPFFSGEGYIHPDMMPAARHIILQFGSGGFGPWVDLEKFAGFSMKYGQDAKKGKGGHLPGVKNDLEIALIRCVEALRPLTSPNPQHLQYSIEELPMRVETLRALLGDEKLIGADAYGTAWNFPEIVVALARAGFDYITIKAGDGSTGAAHLTDLKNRGLNVVYLAHIADLALREAGLRDRVSLIAEGGVKDGFEAMLVLLAGADFVGIGMAQFIPLGCTLCERCHTDQCAWGITTRRYGHRIDPFVGAKRIVEMNRAWLTEMEGLAAGLGMSTHQDVVGARRFRYHGPDPLLYETFGKGEISGQVEKSPLSRAQAFYLAPLSEKREELKGFIERVLENVCGDELHIDVDVELGSLPLNLAMKEAAERGVRKFHLHRVCGQRYIGVGVKAEEIHVHGLSGNNSFAFTRGVRVFTYPDRAGKTLIPGDAQVAVANTSNPKEINIAGRVNDLFASYAVSGRFRVAKGGGVRNLLLFKAGLPEVWVRECEKDYSRLSDEEVVEELLRRYQERKAFLEEHGFDKYIERYRKDLEERVPPVGIFGLGPDRGMGDYFMEYAQGGIGILLNIFDLESPVGYYLCSGLSAGCAYIRGKVREEQLGIGVKLVREVRDSNERKFLEKEIADFIRVFEKAGMDEEYMRGFDRFAERFAAKPEEILDEFVKVVPLDLETVRVPIA
ncbi:MAG: glutamate synthase [Deltaproteobacteria bacterium]|nr:MAG: glutamate synthase [Deltaproteobacteria bacterium]